MKSKAFTLIETVVSIIILGILGSVLISVMHPSKIQTDALIKAGAYARYQIDIATKQILAKNSKNYSMLTLFGFNKKQFSINDEGAEFLLSELYKKYLVAMRNKTISNEYLNYKINIQDSQDKELYIKDFKAGFYLRHDAYFALKLNGNCEKEENIIYSPIQPDNRVAINSCGLIFYDVNGPGLPNSLGVDQYIFSIGTRGLK